MWSVLCYAALNVVLKDVSQREQVLNGSQAILKHLRRNLDAKFVRNTLVLPHTKTFDTQLYSQAAIDEAPSCVDYGCASPPAHPCSDESLAMADTIIFQYPIMYGVRAKNSHSLPSIAINDVPGNTRFLPMHLLTFDNCFDCYGECEYQKLTVEEDKGCSCVRVRNSDTWILNATDLILPRKTPDVSLQATSQKLQFDACVGNCGETSTAPDTLDAEGANLANAMGRGIPRKHIPQLQPAAAGDVHECQASCDAKQCLMWTWDGIRCAHLFELSAESPPLSRAFDVTTSLRWQGYNTSAKSTQNMWPPLSKEPFKYGLSAPATKTYIAECNTLVNKTLGLQCKLEVKAWCANHWLCADMPCNCKISDVAPNENILARMLYYNMGYVADISAFDAVMGEFYKWTYDGGALHSNLPLYNPAYQTVGFDNQILRATDTTFFNPFVPLGLQPPAGIVPGAPWSNVLPDNVACPNILAPEDVSRYEPAVAAYSRAPSGVGAMPRYKSPTLSTITCDVNKKMPTPSLSACATPPLWTKEDNSFFALQCCQNKCTRKCMQPYPEPMPFASISDCDGDIKAYNDVVNEAALILPPWVSTGAMYNETCSNHSRKEAWEGCDEDADCTFFGSKTGQYQLRRAGDKNVQCFKTDHVINAPLQNPQTTTISAAQAVQHVQKHAVYALMRNAHEAHSAADDNPVVVQHNHTNNTAAASYITAVANNNASVVRVGVHLYCSVKLPNCTAQDVLQATPILQLRAKRAFVQALQNHDNASWALVDKFAGSQPWRVLGYDPALECEPINANCNLKTAHEPVTRVLDDVRVRLDGTMVYGKRKQYAPKWKRCLLRAVSARDNGTLRYTMHVCGGVVCTHGAYETNNCSINRYNLATFRAQALRGANNRNVTLSDGTPGLMHAIRRFATWLCRVSQADWACETYNPLENVQRAIKIELQKNTSYAAVKRAVRVTNVYDKVAVVKYPNPIFDTPTVEFVVPILDNFTSLPYETKENSTAMTAERLMLLDFNRSAVKSDMHPLVQDANEALIDTYADNTRVTQLKHAFAANDLSFAHPASLAFNREKDLGLTKQPAAAALVSPLQAARQRRARAVLPYAPQNSPVRTVSVPSNITPAEALMVCESAMCAGVQTSRQPAPTPPNYDPVVQQPGLTDPVVGPPLPSPCPLIGQNSVYGCGKRQPVGRRLQEGQLNIPERNLSKCEDGSAAILGPFGEAQNCSRDCSVPPRVHGFWPGFDAAPNHVFSGAGKAFGNMLRNCPKQTFNPPVRPTVAVDSAETGVAMHVGNVVYDLRQNIIRASDAAPGAHARAHLRLHAPKRGSTALACKSSMYATAQQQMGLRAHLIPGSFPNLTACVAVQASWPLQLLQHGEVRCKEGTWRNKIDGWVSVRGSPSGTWEKAARVAARSKAVWVDNELYASSDNGTSLQASQHYVRLLAASSGNADHTFIAGVMTQGPLSTQCAEGAATMQTQTDLAPCQNCVFGANWSAGVVPHNGAVFVATGGAVRTATAAKCAELTKSLVVHFDDGTCTPGVAKQSSGQGKNNVFRAAKCMVSDCHNKPVAQNANATRLIVKARTKLRQAFPFGIPGQQSQSVVPSYAIGTPVLLSNVLCIVYKTTTHAYSFDLNACNGLQNMFYVHNFALEQSTAQLVSAQRARAPEIPGNFFGCDGKQPNFTSPNLYLQLPQLGNTLDLDTSCAYALSTCTYSALGPQPTTQCDKNPYNLQLSNGNERPQFFGSLPVVTLLKQTCEICAVMLDETTALGAVPCEACSGVALNLGANLKVCRCKNYARTTQCASVQRISDLGLQSDSQKNLLNFASCFDDDSSDCAQDHDAADSEAQVIALAFMWYQGRLAVPQPAFAVKNGTVLHSYVAISVAKCAQECAKNLKCTTWQLNTAFFDGTGEFNENNCTLMQGGNLQKVTAIPRQACIPDFFKSCSVSNNKNAPPISFAGSIDSTTFKDQLPAASNAHYGIINDSSLDNDAQIFVCAAHLATAPAYYVAARFLSGKIPITPTNVTTNNCTGISFMVENNLILGAWYRLGDLPPANNLQAFDNKNQDSCAANVKWQGLGYTSKSTDGFIIAMSFAHENYFQVDIAKHAFRVSRAPCEGKLWFKRKQTPVTSNNPFCSLAFQQDVSSDFWPLQELQINYPVNLSSAGTRDGVTIKLHQNSPNDTLTEVQVLSSDDLLRGTVNTTAALATAVVQDLSALPHPGTLQCSTAVQNVAKLNEPFAVVSDINLPDDCCAHCMDNNKCLAYTWDKDARKCELFNDQTVSFAHNNSANLWGANAVQRTESPQAVTVTELLRMLRQSFNFTQRIIGDESSGFAAPPPFVPAKGVIALDANYGSSTGVRCSIQSPSQIAQVPNYLRFMFPGVPMSNIKPCNAKESPPLNADNKINLQQFPFKPIQDCKKLSCMAVCANSTLDLIGTLGDCNTGCKCVFKTPALQNAYTTMLENAQLDACSADTSMPTLAPPDGSVVDSSVVQGIWQSSIDGKSEVVGTIVDPGLETLLLPEVVHLRQFKNMQDAKIVQSVTDEGVVLVSVQSDVPKNITTTTTAPQPLSTTAEQTSTSQAPALQTTPQPTKQASSASMPQINVTAVPQANEADDWKNSSIILGLTCAASLTFLLFVLMRRKK